MSRHKVGRNWNRTSWTLSFLITITAQLVIECWVTVKRDISQLQLVHQLRYWPLWPHAENSFKWREDEDNSLLFLLNWNGSDHRPMRRQLTCATFGGLCEPTSFSTPWVGACWNGRSACGIYAFCMRTVVGTWTPWWHGKRPACGSNAWSSVCNTSSPERSAMSTCTSRACHFSCSRAPHASSSPVGTSNHISCCILEFYTDTGCVCASSRLRTTCTPNSTYCSPCNIYDARHCASLSWLRRYSTRATVLREVALGLSSWSKKIRP